MCHVERAANYTVESVVELHLHHVKVQGDLQFAYEFAHLAPKEALAPLVLCEIYEVVFLVVVGKQVSLPLGEHDDWFVGEEIECVFLVLVLA